MNNATAPKHDDSFTVAPLGPPGTPGVMIAGLNEAALTEAETRRRLRDIWIDKGLILFRGLAGVEAHLELSRVFGTLTSHPSGVAVNAKYPELNDIQYTPEDANLYGLPDGRVVGAFLPWHSDLVYFQEINRGGILRCIQPAGKNGETGFIDQIAAYERLPERLKEAVEGRHVVYWGDFRMESARYANAARTVHRGSFLERIIAKRDQFPRVAHPMVFTQQETGRNVLNVSPWFAEHIEGMDTPEGMALLDEVVSYCSDDRAAYFHSWQPEDMVLWDNWRMLHRAVGVPPNERRHMQRTTIMGDYGLGHLVGAPAPAAPEHVDI